jgi:hypothetical protein
LGLLCILSRRSPPRARFVTPDPVLRKLAPIEKEEQCR